MYDGCITLAAGLSRTRRNNMDANSYLELGRTGQNGTAQDRVKPQTEHLTAAVGPYIKEWYIAGCWTWTEWPDREIMSPSSTNQDIGIDVVAVRGGDGRHVALQCKSRRLENGIPAAIQKSELDSFANASSNPFWAERWLVANGKAPFSPQAEQALSMAGVERPIKAVNIHADLLSQSGGQRQKALPALPARRSGDGTTNQEVYAGRRRRHSRPRSPGPRPEQ